MGLALETEMEREEAASAWERVRESSGEEF